MMTYSDFLTHLSSLAAPVVLLEGTRQLPPQHSNFLVTLGKKLATDLPNARFRTGNASGSDDAFADGVSQVAPERLEYVVPTTKSRITHRRPHGLWIALTDLAAETEVFLAEETALATPQYRSLMQQRGWRKDAGIKAPYLIRDTLKVTGAAEAGLAPASIGIFYLNPDNPTQGGTAHTWRVCERYKVPTVAQTDWLIWLNDRPA